MRRRWLLTLLIFIGFTTQNTNAEEFTFNVEPIRHPNQVSEASYFDLLVEPDSSHSLLVNLTNNQDVPIIINADVVNGGTAVNGDSSVYEIDSKIDESMKYPLTTLIDSQRSITVPAKSELTATFKLKTPNETFEGKIIGGIRFSSENSVAEEQSDENAIVFENVVNYVVGVQIQQDLKVPDSNLNLKKNGISAINFLPSFTSTIQNDQSVLMRNVEIFGEIHNSKNELVGSIDKAQSVIMPNSSFDVSYTSLNNKIESGNYSMYLKIRENDNIWEWKETFKISFDEVDQINGEVQQVYPDTSPNYMPWIIGLMSLLLVIILLLFILLFKRRKEDEEEEA